MVTTSVVESTVETMTEALSVEVTLATVDVDALDIHALNADILSVDTLSATEIVLAAVLVTVFAAVLVTVFAAVLVTMLAAEVLQTAMFAAAELVILEGDFLGDHDFTSVTSLSFEDDLLVDDGLLEKSLTTLAARFLVRTSLDDFSLDDLNDLLTDDAEFASGDSTFNDLALNDLDDFDFASNHLRLTARLALDKLSFNDLAGGDLNQLDFAADALLRVASFLMEAFHTKFLDGNALLDGDNTVRFVEWRKEA